MFVFWMIVWFFSFFLVFIENGLFFKEVRIFLVDLLVVIKGEIEYELYLYVVEFLNFLKEKEKENIYIIFNNSFLFS